MLIIWRHISWQRDYVKMFSFVREEVFQRGTLCWFLRVGRSSVCASTEIPLLRYLPEKPPRGFQIPCFCRNHLDPQNRGRDRDVSLVYISHLLCPNLKVCLFQLVWLLFYNNVCVHRFSYEGLPQYDRCTAFGKSYIGLSSKYYRSCKYLGIVQFSYLWSRQPDF